MGKSGACPPVVTALSHRGHVAREPLPTLPTTLTMRCGEESPILRRNAANAGAMRGDIVGTVFQMDALVGRRLFRR